MMMIGGGGGGAVGAGGGGGAGGYFYTSSLQFTPVTYSIVVGEGAPVTQQTGGAAGAYPIGPSGSASIITGSNIQIISFGGGGGGSYNSSSANLNVAGANSGGGNGYGTSVPGGGAYGTILTTGIQPLYNATYNSGSNVGGVAIFGPTQWRNGAGGGGGVTTIGSDAIAMVSSNRSSGGAGGTGIANPIIGSTIGELSGSVYYVGGGGGGAGGTIGSGNGPAGLGGGGLGGKDEYTYPVVQPSDATAGMPNTGGGGGGVLNGPGQPYGFATTAGGTGVVIIKYQYKCFNT
jgi:hypothetical protein